MDEYKKIDPSITPQAWNAIQGLKSFVDDGRPLEVQLAEREEVIRKEGMRYSPSYWRNSMITGMRLRPAEWGKPTGDPGENLIMTGCQPLTGADEFLAYLKLVQRLGARYTFLTKEYCCGVSFSNIPLVRLDKETREKGLAKAKEFIGMNIDEARRLGVKKMYYVCPWCVYHARRFFNDCDVEQLYYMDFVVDLVNKVKPKLQLDGTAAYYQGCQARRHLYVGPVDWDCDWAGYRALMDKIEGLKITVELPKGMCCATHADRVIARAREKQVTHAVTPCWSCSTYLRVADPTSPFKGVSEILLEALKQ